jgi:hypothetical protein
MSLLGQGDIVTVLESGAPRAIFGPKCGQIEVAKRNFMFRIARQILCL